MPILVRNISIALDQTEDDLLPAVARRLRIPPRAVRAYSIVRRSLDARRGDPHFNYHVELLLDEPHASQRARLKRITDRNVVWRAPQPIEQPEPGTAPLPQRPIIIGFGPGGMFAALRLAQFGYRPIVYERGREVRRRHRDIMQRFYRQGQFDERSNLLFGEGGAGTYSDGKLYTRIHDPLCRVVLEVLYQHGADPDILLDARPHIGSDRLPTICTRIRKKIESLGGEVRFECRLDDIRIRDGRLEAIQFSGPGIAGGTEWIEAGPTILAVGHSARDTIRMLHARGVTLDPKPFQIGVRVEHPQPLVDRWQYGAAAGHQRLGPAEYHCVARGAAAERGDVFSFCMCPGGMILPTNESAGLIATNGASRAKRSSPFANSGLVLTLDPTALRMSDSSSQGFDSTETNAALMGLAFLEHWEQLAFVATSSTYAVPCQRAADFLQNRNSDGSLETSYPLGGRWTDVRPLLPEVVVAALQRALPVLERRFPGFAGDEGVITVPETRASAPVRLTRNPQTREALGVAGLYPVGEGAGYAGGIVSAAVDGFKTADTIIGHYAPP